MLKFKSKKIITLFIFSASIIAVVFFAVACKDEKPVEPKPPKEIHPIVGKWKLVAKSKNNVQHATPPENFDWLPVEKEIYQEYRSDSTFENVLFHLDIWETVAQNNVWEYHIIKDMIIYNITSADYPTNAIGDLYVQRYEFSKDKKELTTYLILFCTFFNI